MTNPLPSHSPNVPCPPSHGNQSYRLGYRADIEGLRALAILLVVAAHAEVPGLAGGFVGVDIFFVLSGYLITGLLVQEVRTTGTVRLPAFFGRRLKRLLPALLFMIVSVSCAAAALWSPFEQPGQADAAAAAAVWMSNLMFAFGEIDYFSQGPDRNLFLHTWSLGVEEQFYLLWPLLMLGLLGALRWQRRRQEFRRLRTGMYVVLGVSLLLSSTLTYTHPQWAYYLMPSRAWQFALGALALLWTTSDGQTFVGRTDPPSVGRFDGYLAAGGWIGLGLIATAALLIDERTTYPGVWALVPSVAAALVLMAGSSTRPSGPTRLLSTMPLQRLGRVSYSWYLWHWPVLLLGAVFLTAGTLLDRALLVGASLCLAVISYLLVERPLRRTSALGNKPSLIIKTAMISMFAAVVLTTGWRTLASSWIELPELQQYAQVRKDLPAIYAMGCDDWIYSVDVKACVFGAKNAPRTAVLLGDSKVGQWFPALRSAFATPQWRLVVLTKSSCPMVDEPWYYEQIGREYTECAQWRDATLAALGALHPDVVLLGSSDYVFTKDQWVEGTVRVLRRIAPIAESVFIIRATYSLGFDGPGCLARRHSSPLPFARQIDCAVAAGNPAQAALLEWLEQAASRFDNVSVLDLNEMVCPEGRCAAERDGLIVYRDHQHLSAQYAATLGESFVGLIRIRRQSWETSEAGTGTIPALVN